MESVYAFVLMRQACLRVAKVPIQYIGTTSKLEVGFRADLIVEDGPGQLKS
jgi:hypothetical protein